MTKLTRLILLSTLLSNFYVQTAYAQVVSAIDNTFTVLKADTQVNDVYIQPDPSLTLQLEPRSVPFNINFIGEWTPAAMGAFEYAVGLWGEILTSAPDVAIDINATMVLQGSLGAGALAEAGPGAYYSDLDTSAPTYQQNTFYPVALASRLSGAEVSSVVTDIEINVVQNTPINIWYFGIDGQCPNDKYDFVTAVLHEIGHAIGIATSNTNIFTYGLTGGDGVLRPTIADRFIIAGDEGATSLTQFPMGSAPIELLDYFTSDNLFWKTPFTGIKMYAPELYNPGSSISHIDYDTYNDTEDALFKHQINLGEAIHSPGIVGVNMLRDIGWEAALPTGIEDELQLSYSFNIDCWNNPPCGNNYDLLYGTPVKEYNIGDTNYYDWVFYDDPPYSPVSSINWRVELLHSSGRYVYDSGSTGFYFGVTIGSLPSGYQWDRNLEGQIKAEIIISGTGSDSFFHEDFLPIVINYQPDTPELEFLYLGGRGHCNSVILSFYARGATSYNLHFKPEGTLFYITQQIPSGQFTYEVTGLNESKNYDFIIEGINDYGMVGSDILTRRKCKRIITTFPNPTDSSLTVTDPDGGGIRQVNIYNVNNNNLEFTLDGDNYSNELNMNISRLPIGSYDVEVIDSDGNSTHQIIFKY